ncbi:MAG: methylated-DNA--[protein]-cysteine S-methyltransferase [Desulfobacterales bacterium]|nr:methylated-DNA--[protein]-cysteine S-methyltransferase [Desulfobacterales bacterium]
MKNPSKEWVFCLPETPLGPLWCGFTDRGLAALEFVGDGPVSLLSDDSLPAHLMPLIEAVQRELSVYFGGIPTDFASLTLDLRSTPFQLRVWQELRRIPWGQAISYGELARRVGNPKASRAVGQANAVNPIPLIIPCHRVIAADGSLGGYSSGPDRKRWLLRHEGAM